jgi:hypothetical protein
LGQALHGSNYMARKKSVRKAAQDFRSQTAALKGFLTAVTPNQSKEHVSWLYEAAVIRLYREFELLVLEALVGAINNDTATISTRVGIEFPKHLTDEVCEFLVIGDGFFDFKGRDGLIRIIKRFVPDAHYLVQVVKKNKYRDALEQVSALRNLAAHDSSVARKRARETVGQKRIGSSGSWLKTQDRLNKLVTKLDDLSTELEANAPF